MIIIDERDGSVVYDAWFWDYAKRMRDYGYELSPDGAPQRYDGPLPPTHKVEFVPKRSDRFHHAVSSPTPARMAESARRKRPVLVIADPTGKQPRHPPTVFCAIATESGLQWRTYPLAVLRFDRKGELIAEVSAPPQTTFLDFEGSPCPYVVIHEELEIPSPQTAV